MERRAFMKLYNADASATNTLEVYAKDTDCCADRNEVACAYKMSESGATISSFKSIVVEVDGAEVTVAFDENTTAGDAKSLRTAIRAAMKSAGYNTKNLQDSVFTYVDAGDDEVDIFVYSSLKVVKLVTAGDVDVTATELCTQYPVSKFEFTIPGDDSSVAVVVNKPSGAAHENYSITLNAGVDTAADGANELQTNLTTVHQAEVTQNAADDFDVVLWVYQPFAVVAGGTALSTSENDQVFAASVPTP
jgi:X-X-X-Leu-X-X-Gly heptad repeat protein